MSELHARVATNGMIELADEKSLSVASPMPPLDSAYLARELLSLSALSETLEVGTLGGDAHLPVIACKAGIWKPTGKPILQITTLPGVEITFSIDPQLAKALGAALISAADLIGPLQADPSRPLN